MTSIDAHGAGRRRITAHARRGGDGELRVGFAAASSHAIVAIDDCPILDPGLRGALDAARALAEVLKPTTKPLDIQVTATDGGLDVDVRGSGPLPTAMIATLVARGRAASAGAADAAWRTGVDARAAGGGHRHRAGDAAAGFVPAGDRRGRGSAGRIGGQDIARAQNISPICFAGSGRSRCGSRRARASRHSTAMPAR